MIDLYFDFYFYSEFEVVFNFDSCLCLLSSCFSHSSLCIISNDKSYYQDGHTALHKAAQNGDIEIVRVLLAGHANTEAVTKVSQKISIASSHCT